MFLLHTYLCDLNAVQNTSKFLEPLSGSTHRRARAQTVSARAAGAETAIIIHIIIAAVYHENVAAVYVVHVLYGIHKQKGII